MRVAVQKIPGVDSIRVSLNQGLAVIRLKPENRVTVAEIREVVRRNGFTPKAADIRVSGTLAPHEGQWLLMLPEAEQRLALRDSAGAIARLAETARGRRVTVEGRVPEANAYIVEVLRATVDEGG